MTKKILFAALTLSTTITFAFIRERDQQQLISKNLLRNGGAEEGLARWTASAGSFTHTTTASQVAAGNGAFSWDAAAASDTLTSSAVAIPAGAYGQAGVAYCYFKGASAVTHQIEAYDGTNILASGSITSTTDIHSKTAIYFTFPSSGNIQLRVEAQANEAALYIDDCFLGLAEGSGMNNVSQAEFYGAAIWPGVTNCTWSRTANATFGSFTADTDCTSPTGSNLVGRATAPSTKVPGITFPYLPPGRYVVRATGDFNNSTAAVACAWRFTDGTNTTNAQVAGTNLSGDIYTPNIEGEFTYTTGQSNITFEAQATGVSNGTCNIKNDRTIGAYALSVYRFPDQSQTAFNFDTINWKVDAEINGSAINLTTSAVASLTGITSSGLTLTNNTSKGSDSSVQIGCSSTNSPTGTTCSVGDESVSAAFTIPRAGRYEACFSFSHEIATAGSANAEFAIVETATNAQTALQTGGAKHHAQFTNSGTVSNTQAIQMCEVFTFSTVGQKMLRLFYKQSTNAGSDLEIGSAPVRITVRPIDVDYPAPVVSNSVTSNGTGPFRIESAEINCDASSSITKQTGSWISSVGNRSTTSCAITIASGIFSTEPTACFFTIEAATVQATAVAKASATSITVYGPSADYDGNLICMGPR